MLKVLQCWYLQKSVAFGVFEILLWIILLDFCPCNECAELQFIPFVLYVYILVKHSFPTWGRICAEVVPKQMSSKIFGPKEGRRLLKYWKCC